MFAKQIAQNAKHPEGKITFKRFKDLEREKKELHKKMKDLEKDKMDVILSQSRVDPSILPVPLPADIKTFSRIALQQAKEGKEGGQKKGLGFGVGPRIPLSNKEKWQAKVPLYNTHADKPLDLKADPTPAPNAYSLISYWPGKKESKPSKRTESEGKLPNILAKVSKGPVFSPYYVKIR